MPISEMYQPKIRKVRMRIFRRDGEMMAKMGQFNDEFKRVGASVAG